MTNLCYQSVAEEVSKDLGHVVDDRSNSKQSGRAAVILQMPEQESEDQSDAKAHEPSDEQEGHALWILKLSQHSPPFRSFT